MQTAAIEQAKVIERQQAELARLRSMSSVPAMFSNTALTGREPKE